MEKAAAANPASSSSAAPAQVHSTGAAITKNDSAYGKDIKGKHNCRCFLNKVVKWKNLYKNSYREALVRPLIKSSSKQS